MQTAVHKRILVLAGLMVLSLVVLAAGAQIVQAMLVVGAGAQSGGSATSFSTLLKGRSPARVAQHQQFGTTAVASTSLAGTQGRGGVNASVPAPVRGDVAVPASTTSASSTSSTAWIIVGAVIAALAIIVVAWALARRRRRSEAAGPGSAAFCALHPEDALCGAA